MRTAYKLAVAGLALACSHSVLAVGTPASDDVTVTTTIKQALSATANANLTFGDVFTDATNPTIAATDGDAGSIDIVGEAGEAVTVTFNSTLTLTDSVSGDTLSVTAVTAHDGTAAITSGNTMTLDGSGEGTITIGGTLDIQGATDPSSGDYEGPLTVTVEYQ